MADFFKQPLEPVEEKQPEIEKIKLGDEEFDPEELKEIVGKGRFAKEVEEKYNTKLDKVWPEYTKATQRLKEYEQKEKQWEEERNKAPEPSVEVDEEELTRQAKSQAKKLGLVTVDDIDSYVSQKLTSFQQATEMLDECRGLEKEYSGDDGKPKFDTGEVLEHMKETGIKNPLKAYKDLYEEQLDKWKEEQFAKARKSNPYTESGLSGNHEPSDVKLTKDNLEAVLSEVLHPSKDE
jgi:hypothetical protein